MLLRQTVLLNLEQVPEGKRVNIKFIFLRGRGEIGNYGVIILTSVYAIIAI